MMKKSIIWIAGILGVLLIIFLAFIGKQGETDNIIYEGKVFEDSKWPFLWEDLYWDELYEVCESAENFGITSEGEQIHILYEDKEDFNADVANLLQYVIDSCGEPYYGTRGESTKAYISKPGNTGTYEEELSWISLQGFGLGVRLARVGSGEDVPMKVIITNEPLQFMEGEVVKSDNTELIVQVGDEPVMISWNYETGKRYLSETTPLYQTGDKVYIGIREEQQVEHHDGNAYGTLGVKYLRSLAELYEEGFTYTLKVNEKVITENKVSVAAGDLIVALAHKQSEAVTYSIVEGNRLSTGSHEAILEVDYPGEETGRDGTTVGSYEYHMKNVPAGQVIHVTITKELQERLGLESDVIEITCE